MTKRAKYHLLIILGFILIPAVVGGAINSIAGNFGRGFVGGAIVGLLALLVAEWSPGVISNHLDTKFGKPYPS